ncbi:MAG: hypothetical protein GWN11_05100 [Candidatus Dadabacteria bacterium]|nr:hypothetical protein [Candidatus Dadabacteria bacterium]NIX15253.1 hypothetical protein [Candidatus Dadabacteria bacterium]
MEINEMYGRIQKKLNHFFFQSGSSKNLGISRFLFFGIVFIFYCDDDFSYWADVPEFLWSPIIVFKYLHIHLLTSEILKLLSYVWLLSLFLSSIGLFTRFSTVVAFIVGFYLLGIVNSIGKLQHMENMMVLVFAVMAFSRSGDSFSIDRWLKDRSFLYKSDKSSVTARQIEGEYTWPVRLIWVLMTLVFCAAAVSKLRNSGIEWITSDNLSNIFILVQFVDMRGEPVIESLAPWLGGKPLLCSFLAGTIVVLEMFAPLALFHSILRAVIVPSLFLMVCGFWIVMGVPFPQLLMCFIFWVPWDRLTGLIKQPPVQVG